MENNETYLTKLYKNKEELDTTLTPSQILMEIDNLKSLSDDHDALQTLFIIENLHKHTNKHDFCQAAFSCIKFTPKYMVYNIRILNIINSTALKQDKYFPLANIIIQLLKILKVEEDKRVFVDMNKIKIGSEIANTTGYIEYVVEKLVLVLKKNINVVSNKLGFPEMAYWIVKELKNVRIECKAMSFLNEIVEDIEEHRKYLMDERNKVKLSVYEKKEVERIENSLNKIINS